MSKTKKASEKEATFHDLALSPKLLAILDKHNFVTPTPIQEKAIPVALEGTDVVGIAQTGTGKTLAFVLPMIQRVSRTRGQGLILAPTRELALQAEETIKQIGGDLGVRTAVLIGGASMRPQLTAIKRKPHIIIATPGRIIDHLEQGNLKLDKTNVLVLDEADRMLDMGFAPQIRKVIKRVKDDRQTMLFSATMPPDIAKIAKDYMRTPIAVEVARQGQTAEGVDQELYVVDRRRKTSLLAHVLEQHKGSTIVFTRTKYGAKKVARMVRQLGHDAVEIHGNRTLAQRKSAIKGFKEGTYRVLVATDVVGRGIDITGVELVVNYDLPEQAEDYVHRVGRTGRAGATGKAISFAGPDQGDLVNAIEALTRQRLPMSKAPGELPKVPEPPRGRGGRSGSRDRGSSRGRRGDTSRSSSRPERSSRPKRAEQRSSASPSRGKRSGPRKKGSDSVMDILGGRKGKKSRFKPKKFFGGMGV